MEEHKFIAKNFDTNLFTKLHCYAASLFGRKDTLKDFCFKSGIDYKPIKGKKYNLPSTEYTIQHDELTYLGGIRDKSVLSLYERYVDCQLATEHERTAILNNISTQKEIIQTAKELRTILKQKLKSAKVPIVRIKLQNDIGVVETKIANEAAALTELENQLDAQDLTLEANLQNWQKQLEIIDTLFRIQRERFDKSISKRIRKYLNFTNCHSYLPEYSSSAKETIKGEYHEKE